MSLHAGGIEIGRCPTTETAATATAREYERKKGAARQAVPRQMMISGIFRSRSRGQNKLKPGMKTGAF